MLPYQRILAFLSILFLGIAFLSMFMTAVSIESMVATLTDGLNEADNPDELMKTMELAGRSLKDMSRHARFGLALVAFSIFTAAGAFLAPPYFSRSNIPENLG
jgi:hypothetical protein